VHLLILSNLKFLKITNVSFHFRWRHPIIVFDDIEDVELSISTTKCTSVLGVGDANGIDWIPDFRDN